MTGKQLLLRSACLFFTLVAVYLSADPVRLLFDGRRTYGNVARFEHRGEITYTMVTYSVAGLSYEAESIVPGYYAGQRVPVLYRKDRPKDARIDTPVDMWGIPLGVAALSLGLGLASTGSQRQRSFR
jgi:hypothetical protein